MRLLRTLLGARGLVDSLCCLKSAIRAFGAEYRLEIFDDGTLSAADIERLTGELPCASVVSLRTRQSEIDEKLAPYPLCMRARASNILFYKLFDVMLYRPPDYMEYVDSDVYFLRCVPGGLRRKDFSSIFMTDVASSYSLRPGELLRLSPLSLPARLNTGMIGALPTRLDLDFLEYGFGQPLISGAMQRTPCWAEQTCWAMLAGRSGATLIDSADARVVASTKTITVKNEKALHFVSSYRSLLPAFAAGYPAPVFALGDTGWNVAPARHLDALELFRSGLRRRVTALSVFQ